MAFACMLRAGEVELPAPTGQYSTGTRSFELHDASRQMLRDSNLRRWVVQAYYPVAGDSSSLSDYRPETLDGGMVDGVHVVQHARPNAPLLQAYALPVIFFIPDIGHGRQDYTILCEELASRGYVVLSIDEPYVANYVRFSDGTTIVPQMRDLWSASRIDACHSSFYDEALDAATGDCYCMLDQFEVIAERYFNRQLDPSRITLMGHGFGGDVIRQVGLSDMRITALIDIDSALREFEGRLIVNEFERPLLFIRAMLSQQYHAIGSVLSEIINADMWAPRVEHNAFTDDAYLVHMIANYGQQSSTWLFLNWFFKWGPVFSASETGIGRYEIHEWIDILRHELVLWIVAHVPYVS